ncbi:hypothetical protein SCHPADRAFT_1000142 [Schizopora paradoxa]|uniref:F-box domain-containing protein n=1 Tax=Schizopora paradoxa TaxID=27342 RepID=A0A0H2RXX5_9AGAM|nr:hypothetical protein SCHPADRAFT_1000142 [Schizopora paradoxa]
MSSPDIRKSQPLFSEDGEPPKEGVQLQDDTSNLRATNEMNSVVTGDLRGEDGLQLPEELQREEDLLNIVTCSAPLEKGIDRISDGGSTLVVRARQYLSRLGLLDGLPTEISSELKEKADSARQRVNRVVTVCGIASLPSEILILIFSLSIDCSSRDIPHPLHSVRLSHVCRLFRNIITTTSRFWTEISSIPHAPKVGLVEACLQRSGDSPLNVHLNVYIFPIQIGAFPVPEELQLMFPNGVLDLIEGINCDPTLSSLALHAHRWRNLHLNVIPVNDMIKSSFGFELIQNTIFPTLESVTVYRESASLRHRDQGRSFIEKECSREMGFASSWTTPMLRTLNLRDTLPSSLPESSLAAITTVRINLSTFNDVSSLYALFSKLERVEEVHLDVSRLGTSWNEDQLERIQDVVLGSAKRVTLRFDEDAGLMELWQATFFKLYCPNATSLAVEATRCSKEPKRAFLYHLLPKIPARFPKVKNYTVSVKESLKLIGQETRKPTSLPLHFPPDLEHFTFTCDSSLWFSEKGARKIIPRVSRLRTLTLGVNPSVMNDIKPALDWVRWIADYIQPHNRPEQMFEKLVLLKFDCSRGYRYRIKKIIPRDEIEAWCASGVVLPETLSEVEETEYEEPKWSE